MEPTLTQVIGGIMLFIPSMLLFLYITFKAMACVYKVNPSGILVFLSIMLWLLIAGALIASCPVVDDVVASSKQYMDDVSRVISDYR